ncbi:MAG TPA: hypothetical protein VNT26_17695, partial [Candidatus Sulfotelmatobacter sp.]|nr:hypothetical protein [Candidatus Sulfotelmatobacter sp.]
QSTDFFPTFADVLQLKLPTGHRFDGKSFAPALRGQAHDRGPTFCHFPHNMPVAGGLASTWVRMGDWKLIRFFCLEEDQSDRLELYNLKDDLGETRNLAAQNPAKAKELNALIDGFLKDSEAVVPAKNPRYNPNAKPAPASPSPGRAQSRQQAVGDPRLELEANSEGHGMI